MVPKPRPGITFHEREKIAFHLLQNPSKMIRQLLLRNYAGKEAVKQHIKSAQSKKI